MSYWGDDIADCDFAAGAVGAIIYLIKERMLKDVEAVKAKNHPEQSIVASLVCLRAIGEHFPQNLSVHFRKKDFEQFRAEFDSWLERSSSIPESRKKALRASADSEFRLFQERILDRKEKPNQAPEPTAPSGRGSS